jgi:hypothetical protein
MTRGLVDSTNLADQWKPAFPAMQRLLSCPNKTSVRLRTAIALSILEFLAIVSSVSTVAKEHRDKPEFLQNKYQDLNRKFFANSLPPARIEWADLTVYKYLGETYLENDGTFVVLVDRKTNFRDEDLVDTVFHEMCHVATWRKENDPHGVAFRACMDKIKGNVLQNSSMVSR